MLFRLSIPQRSALHRLRRTFISNEFLCINQGEGNTFDLSNTNKLIGNCQITIREGNHNHIQVGEHSKFNQFSIAIQGNDNQVILGNQVKLSGKLLIVGNNLKITIGENTTAIGLYVLARDRSVHIGKDCMISRNVEIRASDVHKIFTLDNNHQVNLPIQDIVIGDHIWIAANVTISKNVQLAPDCIIGAGSFVNSSCNEPHCILAGSPAKIVKRNVRWER